MVRNCSTSPEVFWGHFSVWSPNKFRSAMQCKADQYMTCVLLAKNPLSRVLSSACFSRTSFHLCLLQPNVLSQVCLSLSPMSASGKHSFMCLSQKKHHPIQLTFQRNLKFPLHSRVKASSGFFYFLSYSL